MKNIWWAWITILFFVSSYAQCEPERWVWIHRKRLSSTEQKNNSNKKLIRFEKEGVPFFSQLIFSWNALRPKTGYFSFWVQARNAQAEKWSVWHKMIDWGAAIQRSYYSNQGDFSHYAHVRLEIDKNILADAFRIRVVAHEGANISLLQNLTVTLSNNNLFQKEICNKCTKGLPSLHIAHVPRIAQFAIDHVHKHRICSPVSCTMLTRFLTEHTNTIDPITFAYNVFDDGLDAYGSWPFNTAHAFEWSGGKMDFFVTRLNSFTELYAQLKQGIPVIVSVRGNLEGAPQGYPNGHLLVVVGWDRKKQQVICHDPAFEDDKKVVNYYPLKSFIRSWERSYRLAYWAKPTHNFQ